MNTPRLTDVQLGLLYQLLLRLSCAQVDHREGALDPEAVVSRSISARELDGLIEWASEEAHYRIQRRRTGGSRARKILRRHA